ncbi:hypothetical protein [Sporosarcina highlanderae]|uniref:Uncharacterized protein n=1 Tax=Sporosarcina highlanderae TaxID=3035916 RepID=A0ABT8JSB5_9BACL|nr:hypothetical protein [Sporosarcina highlanderae]MDN4608046.1 hypothetical protein [Sporosarcina highlanderae]
MEQKKIELPNDLFDGMMYLTQVISPARDHVAIVIMGENMDEDAYDPDEFSVIRLYLFIDDGRAFSPVQEIEAFSFKGLEDAYGFLKALPEMSAMDLMLRMNGLTDMIAPQVQ